MAQPQWITPSGSLGTIPEGVFYSTPVQAVADGENVFFQLIAGDLPEGVQVSNNGQIQGVPKNIVRVQGVPLEVSVDTTSKFAIRAYTVRTINGRILVDRINDRTFTLTVTGQDVPEFVTPAGNVGTFYDGTTVDIRILFTDRDPDDDVTIKLLTGELPPGLTLNSRTGLISGLIAPLVGPPGTATPGYDATQFAEYPFDFSTRSASKNYQFTLEITDGKSANARTFEIFVYSKDSMTADTTDFSADNTFITADVVPTRTPMLLTPPGDLGRVRADNFYAFKFDAIDFDGDPIEYSVTVGPGIGFDETGAGYDTVAFDRGSLSLPPGLTINPTTGWFYGYIPDQGATEQTYQFAVRVFKVNNPSIISDYYFFTVTIIGNIDAEVTWLTNTNLGHVPNGSISTLSVRAVNRAGRSLQYRLQPGSNSRLPQGLTLQSSGNITGRVSFNTFCLDGGTTTFDVNLDTRLDIDETTFDNEFQFTVNAFAAESEQIGYQVDSITILDGGSGYVSQPTVTISAPPETLGSIQATAGVVTIEGGVITNIEVGNPGRGYTSPPTVTITGGGGSGAAGTAQIIEATISNAVSVLRRFTVTVDRVFSEPYENLYIKCMPPRNDREILDSLLQNRDIIPVDAVYRPDDPNFGIATNVIYTHAFGLTAAKIEDYVAGLDINHYLKNLTLGQLRTARALDSQGNVLYELVYSNIVDDLVNNQGESVSKAVQTAYPVELDGQTITTVYPNSLINMRDQVIDTVGQISPALPLWMTTKQVDGRVLGFTPAWVIAYAKPGQANRVLYNIQTQWPETLNIIDYQVDRYEIDRSQTWQWDQDTDQWQPQPPAATVFDTFQVAIQDVGWNNDNLSTIFWVNNNNETVFWNTPPSGFPQSGTVFDGNSTRFITPSVRWEATDHYDKYLVFPRRNILE